MTYTAVVSDHRGTAVGCAAAACRGAIPADVRVLPDRIILVRHAQSEGNVDCGAYTYIPDPQVPLVSALRKHSAAAEGRCTTVCLQQCASVFVMLHVSPMTAGYTGMSDVLESR
jgi:hypothetical protein